MRIVLLIFFFSHLIAGEVPKFLQNYKTSDDLVIVIPDNASIELKSLARNIALKYSKIYPEDFVKEESYVDRFKLNYYSKYGVIMLGKLDDFSLMKSYRFFPWKKMNKSYYFLDHGLVIGDFTLVFSGDNPYSLAKSQVEAGATQVSSTPFIYLGGTTLKSVEEAVELFFDNSVISAMLPTNTNDLLNFSRLKANQLSIQEPVPVKLPLSVKIPKNLNFVGYKQARLKDFELIYELLKSFPNRAFKLQYHPKNLKDFTKVRSLLDDLNYVLVLEFSYPQQASQALAKLKKQGDYKVQLQGKRIFMSRF